MKNSFLSSTRARLGSIVTVGAVLTTQASAALDTSGVTFQTDDAVTVAGLVLIGVAAIWGVKKAISMGNRG